jgi:NAD(P)-dependent dehydrogenase (short-subunit alcohol dehydrogenase family)
MTLPAPNFRLDGRAALVTGASRGIGLAAAVALAQAGAHVTLAARTESELVAACEDIHASGGQADYVVIDVTDAAAIDKMIDARGPFHVLVNNAGMNRPKPLVEVTNEDIDDIFRLNVSSVFYITRAVARGLLKAGQAGSIINISSQMGHVGAPRRTVYCASKHAIEGMTKALAWELGQQNIRVNSLCPTFIETDLTRSMLDDPVFKASVISKIALGRVGQTQEVMGSVVFLASDASSLMTGSALMLDGGWTAT